MNIIDKLKDKLDNIIYPITIERAIYDDGGTRLDSKINAINDRFTVENITISPIATATTAGIQAFKVGDIVTISGVIVRTGGNLLMNATTETTIATIPDLANRPSVQVETAGVSDYASDPVIVRVLPNGNISVFCLNTGLAVRFSITYNTKI